MPEPKKIPWLAAAALVLVTACNNREPGEAPATPATPGAGVAATDAGADWDGFVSDWIDSYFEINPPAGVTAGRHEFDGRLPDFSADGVAKATNWLRESRQQAQDFDDRSLDDRERFERDYLVATANGLLFNLATSNFLHTSPVFYSSFTSPSTYITVEYAPLAQRLRSYTKYAAALPAYLEQMQANLSPPLAQPYIETALGIFGGLSGYLGKDVPKVFAAVEDDKLQSAFATANASAVAAIDELVSWLKSQQGDATGDYALGAAKFRQMLRETEGVDIDLAELKAAGEADLERNLAALKKACSEFAPGKPEAACIDKAEADKPEGGTVAGARRQLDELRAFIEDHKLVSVPGTEVAKVEEAPPYARFNLAYIEIPGPYEKNLPSVYYIAPPDPEWPAAKQEAYRPGETELLFITVHEVWPGHFLHYLHANRAASKFGRIFQTYSFTEGWAHYTEEMMWDAGLREGDPQAHIGQLTNALLRNVRFLSAIGLHTEGMSVEESQHMFEQYAFQDAGNAIQQARRGTFDPGYLNYTLGKLMIMKLRDDWTASRGGREAWREFHDELLSYGGPPVPMVRKAMLGDDYSGDPQLLPTAPPATSED